jgi:hypothetical protein
MSLRAAALPRQQQVEDHAVVGARQRALESLLAIGYDVDDEALGLEGTPKEGAYPRLVLDYQNAHVSVPRSEL